MGPEHVVKLMRSHGYSPEEIANFEAACNDLAGRQPDPEVDAWREKVLVVAGPARLLRQWHQTDGGREGYIMDNARTGRRVIVSVGREDDGEVWLHGSISRRDRQLPTYDDLTHLHTLFMGSRLAYQLFLPPSEHYTLPHAVEVLHLWAPLTGGRRTPDFRHYGGV